jgi:hypothetical protein
LAKAISDLQIVDSNNISFSTLSLKIISIIIFFLLRSFLGIYVTWRGLKYFANEEVRLGASNFENRYNSNLISDLQFKDYATLVDRACLSRDDQNSTVTTECKHLVGIPVVFLK